LCYIIEPKPDAFEAKLNLFQVGRLLYLLLQHFLGYAVLASAQFATLRPADSPL